MYCDKGMLHGQISVFIIIIIIIIINYSYNPVLGIEPRDSHMLSMCSITKLLLPSPEMFQISNLSVVVKMDFTLASRRPEQVSHDES